MDHSILLVVSVLPVRYKPVIRRDNNSMFMRAAPINLGPGIHPEMDTIPVHPAALGVTTCGNAGSTITQVWPVTLPASLTPGTYYYIVGAADYYMNCGTTPNQQLSAVFTVPLPPPAFTLQKEAEGNTADPLGLILFTVDYTFVNTNNFVITDPVPTNTTFVGASPGGALSGGNVTWNLGSATTQLAGEAWFLAQVNSGTANGTVINNTASGNTTELPSPASSNTVSVTIGAPAISLNKSESSASVVNGANVTYTLAWTASGQNLDVYDSYDNNSAGTNGNSIQGYYDGTGYTQYGTGTFTVASDPQNNHYLNTNSGSTTSFPVLLRNSPALDILQVVIVEGDLQIPNSGSTPMGADATMVMAYNVSGGVTQAYMLAMSLDNGPGNFFLQKNTAGGPAYLVTLADSALPVTINAGPWYTVKGQIIQSGANLIISGKIWLQGTPEPAAWAFTYTDTTPFPCGETWQQGWQSDGTASPAGDYYSNLKIFGPGPVINPVISDTVPSGITYLNSSVAPTTGPPNLSWSSPGTLLARKSAPITWWGQVRLPGPISNLFSMTSSNFIPLPPSYVQYRQFEHIGLLHHQHSHRYPDGHANLYPHVHRHDCTHGDLDPASDKYPGNLQF